MRSVHDIPVLTNTPVLVRAALNVPIADGSVANEYRLRRALGTLRFLAHEGARTVVISHLGEKGTETLEPVAKRLGTLLPQVHFCPSTTGAEARAAVRALLPGHILVLENLRRNRGEVTNDPAFAAELASLADLYVEDSFDTCHRKHASIIGVPTLLPAYAGLLLEEEVHALTAALTPTTPNIAIIGGAKFATKEPVLTKLLLTYAHVFVGGALANDFLRATGHEVGKSLVADDAPAHLADLARHPRLLVPTDVIVVPAAQLSAPDAVQHARVKPVRGIGPNDVIVDVGPETSRRLATLIGSATQVLWNGPLGNYERGFSAATDNLAQAIAASQAHAVVGGGDTIAAIEKLGLFSKFSFVSTGGGAMLDFLAYGTLPGISVLNEHAREYARR